MDRPCDACGTTYTAKRAASKFCSARCRTRASRGQQVGELVALPATPAAPEPETAGAVERATTVALVEADRIDSPLGQVALALARRIDQPGIDTGSAVAALARQLEATLTAATRGAVAATSPQQLRDELAQRRAAHGA